MYFTSIHENVEGRYITLCGEIFMTNNHLSFLEYDTFSLPKFFIRISFNLNIPKHIYCILLWSVFPNHPKSSQKNPILSLLYIIVQLNFLHQLTQLFCVKTPQLPVLNGNANGMDKDGFSCSCSQRLPYDLAYYGTTLHNCRRGNC